MLPARDLGDAIVARLFASRRNGSVALLGEHLLFDELVDEPVPSLFASVRILLPARSLMLHAPLECEISRIILGTHLELGTKPERDGTIDLRVDDVVSGRGGIEW